jgi:hypothetical protein
MTERATISALSSRHFLYDFTCERFR